MTLAPVLLLVCLSEPRATQAALACPAGTELRGAPPPAGFEVFCEGKDGFGRPRHEGPSRRYYDDGRLWVEESFKEGLRDGAYVEYFRNGNKAREGAYTKGKEEGLFTLFHESGTKEEETEYREGIPDGLFVAYFQDGAKKTEGRRCQGAQCGPWTTYDEHGRVVGEANFGERSKVP